ncbi:MAG: META domain-containing protein [bacterium]
MKNKIIILIVLVALLFAFEAIQVSNKPKPTTTPSNPASSAITAVDAKNATYEIDGTKLTLINGVSIVPVAPGSASTVTTQYFGNEVHHDFNGDGRDDVAFLLTQNTGGSGTFYYVVVALNTPTGYVGSQSYLLGDRIAPQTTEMGKGNIIVVNYADRKPGDSFAVAPSVGKTVWLLLDPATMQFGQVDENFSGEANPAVMTLTMQPWTWIQTTYSNDTVVTPKSAKRFTLTFKNDNTFSASTDCNGVGGTYAATKNAISFTKMMSTLMYCEGSQESDYSKMLGEVKNYHFTSKGELIFDLAMDSGSMVFK